MRRLQRQPVHVVPLADWWAAQLEQVRALNRLSPDERARVVLSASRVPELQILHVRQPTIGETVRASARRLIEHMSPGRAYSLPALLELEGLPPARAAALQAALYACRREDGARIYTRRPEGVILWHKLAPGQDAPAEELSYRPSPIRRRAAVARVIRAAPVGEWAPLWSLTALTGWRRLRHEEVVKVLAELGSEVSIELQGDQWRRTA